MVLTSAGASLVPVTFLRVIDDPHLGDRWLLCRDPDHPGGPGRLLRVTVLRPERMRLSQAGVLEGDQAAVRPVIYAGDRLVIEENSAVVEARLGAVALETAAAGSVFRARLEIGGKVVRAIALGAGRAAFQVRLEAGR